MSLCDDAITSNMEDTNKLKIMQPTSNSHQRMAANNFFFFSFIFLFENYKEDTGLAQIGAFT